MNLIASIFRDMLPVTALLFGALTLSAQQGNANEPLAKVTIEVIDAGGHAAPFAVQNFVDTTRKREMVGHFSGLDGTGIPYGTYNYYLRGTAPFTLGQVIPGRAEVLWPENFVVVTYRYSNPSTAIDTTSHPPGFVIHGKLVPAPHTNNEPMIRLRLNALYGNESLDVIVDGSGDFRIYRPLLGRYLLTVIRGGDVLDIEQVSFDDGSRDKVLVVRLPSTPPPIRTVDK